MWGDNSDVDREDEFDGEGVVLEIDWEGSWLQKLVNIEIHKFIQIVQEDKDK